MATKNIKLSGVELDAFRGFKEHVKFDFLTAEGKLANFIAVFAPNGFGKTSFFEGVERSVKGTIERFDENPTIKNAAAEEGGDILKNRDADAEHGRVRLNDSEGKFFERRTSSSANWDLLPGIIEKKSSSAIKSGLKTFKSNKFIEIMPQSRIDSFLSSKTPQQKYEALLDFWGGKDDSAYFVGISRLCEATTKEIEEHETAIAELKKEIASLAQTTDKVAFFNKLIQVINESKQFKFNLQPFTEETTAAELHDTTKQLNNLIVNSEFDTKQEQDRKNGLQGLLNTYERYLKNAAERKGVTEQFSLFNQRAADLEDLQKRTKEKTRLTKELAQAQQSLESLRQIEAIRQEFSIVAQRIAAANTEKLSRNELIRTLATDSSKATKDLNQYQANLNNFDQSELSVQQNLEKIADFEMRIADNTAKIQPAENRAKLAEKIKLIYDGSAAEIIRGLQSLQQTYKQPIELFVKQSFGFPEFQELANVITKLFDSEESLKKNYEQLRTDFSKAGSLDENLQKLIQFGREHVLETHTDTCPLCQTKQSSYEALVALIETQKKDILGLADLRQQMGILKKEIDEQGILIEKTYTQFIDTLKGYESVLMDRLSRRENKSTNMAGYFQYYDSAAALATAANQRLTADVDKLRKANIALQKQIGKAEEQRKKLTDNITRLTALLADNKFKMDDAQARVSELEAMIKLDQQQTAYVLVQDYLTKSKLAEQEFLTNGLSGKIGSQVNLASELEKQLGDNARQLALLQEKELPTDAINLKRQLKDIGATLNDLVKSMQQFEESYQLLLRSEKFDLATIQEQLAASDQTLTLLQDSYLKLKELQENISLMQANLLVNEKKRDLKKLETERTKLGASFVKLDALKNKVSEFLLSKINAVFNQKTINEIYRKIDPHPDLKEIKLVPEFNEMKPKLHIYAAETDGSNQVNPSLYLSSAQINILSLSIFLAKALQNKDTMINTIFMDDPIQYLDSINVLSFIDLIRTITTDKDIDRQVVISTHDENFFKLLQRKFDTAFYHSKFIRFDSYGKVAAS
jgi:DNA repair exonuclease SbcCD ATPase subunit